MPTPEEFTKYLESQSRPKLAPAAPAMPETQGISPQPMPTIKPSFAPGYWESFQNTLAEQEQEKVLAEQEEAARIKTEQAGRYGGWAGQALVRGLETTAGAAGGLAAIGGELTNIKPLKEAGMGVYKHYMNKAAEIPGTQFKEISGVGSATRWTLEKAIENAPFLIGTFGTGAIGKQLASQVIPKVAGKWLEGAAIKKVGAEASDEVIGLAANRIAKSLGAKAGMIGGTAAVESGGDYADLVERGLGSDKAALSTLATGIGKGFVEMLGGPQRYMGKWLGAETGGMFHRSVNAVKTAFNKGVAPGPEHYNFIRRILGEALRVGSEEGFEEVIQEGMALANIGFNDPNFKVFSAENLPRLLEAGAGGFAVGLVLGGPGGLLTSPEQYAKERGWVPPPEPPSDGGGSTTVPGGEIPPMTTAPPVSSLTGKVTGEGAGEVNLSSEPDEYKVKGGSQNLLAAMIDTNHPMSQEHADAIARVAPIRKESPQNEKFQDAAITFLNANPDADANLTENFVKAVIENYDAKNPNPEWLNEGSAFLNHATDMAKYVTDKQNSVINQIAALATVKPDKDFKTTAAQYNAQFGTPINPEPIKNAMDAGKIRTELYAELKKWGNWNSPLGQYKKLREEIIAGLGERDIAADETETPPEGQIPLDFAQTPQEPVQIPQEIPIENKGVIAPPEAPVAQVPEVAPAPTPEVAPPITPDIPSEVLPAPVLTPPKAIPAQANIPGQENVPIQKTSVAAVVAEKETTEIPIPEGVKARTARATHANIQNASNIEQIFKRYPKIFDFSDPHMRYARTIAEAKYGAIMPNMIPTKVSKEKKIKDGKIRYSGGPIPEEWIEHFPAIASIAGMGLISKQGGFTIEEAAQRNRYNVYQHSKTQRTIVDGGRGVTKQTAKKLIKDIINNSPVLSTRYAGKDNIYIEELEPYIDIKVKPRKGFPSYLIDRNAIDSGWEDVTSERYHEAANDWVGTAAYGTGGVVRWDGFKQKLDNELSELNHAEGLTLDEVLMIRQGMTHPAVKKAQEEEGRDSFKSDLVDRGFTEEEANEAERLNDAGDMKVFYDYLAERGHVPQEAIDAYADEFDRDTADGIAAGEITPAEVRKNQVEGEGENADGIIKKVVDETHVPPVEPTYTTIEGKRVKVEPSTALLDGTDIRGVDYKAGDKVWIRSDTRGTMSDETYQKITEGAEQANIFKVGEVKETPVPPKEKVKREQKPPESTLNVEDKQTSMMDGLTKATDMFEEPGAVRPEKTPLRYDPNTNKYNGESLVRGDVLVDNEGNRYSLDRANGFILTVDTLDENNVRKVGPSFSVDTGDVDRYKDLRKTGGNVFDEQGMVKENLPKYSKNVRSHVRHKIYMELMRGEREAYGPGEAMPEELVKEIRGMAEEFTDMIEQEYLSKNQAGALWLDKKLKDALWLDKNIAESNRRWKERQGEGPKYATEDITKQNIRYKAGTVKPQDTGITAADVKQMFPGAVVTTLPDGTFSITANGNSVALEVVESITPDEAEFQVGYGYKYDPAQKKIIGLYHKGRIKIIRTGNKWYLAHEEYHWLKDIGIINKLDITALNHAIAIKNKIKANEVTEEQQATYIENGLKNRELERNSVLKKMLQKVQDFIDGLINIFHRTARGVIRDIESGKILERSTEDKYSTPSGETRYAADSMPPTATAEEWDADYDIHQHQFQKNVFKTAVNFVKKQETGWAADMKKDISRLAKVISLPMHYTKAVAALHRAWQSWLDLPELKHIIENNMFRTVFGRKYLEEMDAYYKNHKDEAEKKFKPYIYSRDLNRIAWKVTKTGGTGTVQGGPVTWEVKNPQGQVIKTFVVNDNKIFTEKDLEDQRIVNDGFDYGKTIEEAKQFKMAWQYAIEQEAALTSLSDEGKSALIAYRIVADNELETRLKRAQQAMREFESAGKDIPTVPVELDEKGNRIQISLEAAMQEMSELRGSYMPRMRTQGDWKIWATKPGEHSRLEFFTMKGAMKNRALELEQQGFTVEKNVANVLGSDVFARVQSQAAIQNILQASFDKMADDMPLSVLGINKYDTNLQTEPDGTSTLYVTGVFNKTQSGILRSYGKGATIQKNPDGSETWKFIKANSGTSKAINNDLLLYRNVVQGATLDFASILVDDVAETIRSRSSLARGMHRKATKGKDVVLGYETDPLVAITMAGKGIASSIAKHEVAKMMYRAKLGTDEYTWDEWFNKEREEGREPDWKVYRDYVNERKIDPIKQPEAEREWNEMFAELMRAPDKLDNFMGSMRGIASLMYLWGRIPAAAINLTTMGTSIPAAIMGRTGVGLGKAFHLVGQQAGKWLAYKHGKADAETQAVFDYITQMNWHEAQFNQEAVSVLKNKLGRSWDTGIDLGMGLFGMAERINRACSIAAAYQALKIKTGKTDAEIDEKLLHEAKSISDDANGVYMQANMPSWARGSGVFANAARSFYVFRTYTHTYLVTMTDMFMQGGIMNQKGWTGENANAKMAALYMSMAGAVFGGVGSSVLAAAVKLGLGLFRDDDPEEKLYAWINDHFGGYSEQIARYGLAGAVGVNIKGSLQIALGDVPATPIELLGAPGSIVSTWWQGLNDYRKGEIWKGTEKIAPYAISAPLKAIRESTAGVTSKSNAPLFYGNEQVKLRPHEAVLRMASFQPARTGAIREKQWSERKVKMKLDQHKSDMYNKIRAYWNLKPERRTKEKWMDVLEDIHKLNAQIVANGDANITPITRESIVRAMKSTIVPPRKERIRAQLMKQEEKK